MIKLKVPKTNQIMVVMLCIVTSLLGLALGSSNRVTSATNKPLPVRQSENKMIVATEVPTDVLKLTDMRIRNARVTSGLRFNATSISESGGGQVEDWLENLALTFKNVSKKQITYARFDLLFPETEWKGPMMVYNPLEIGVPPGARLEDSSDSKPITLKPGDAVTITLSAKKLQQIKHFLGIGNFQLAELNTVYIQPHFVNFDDGTKWTFGSS